MNRNQNGTKEAKEEEVDQIILDAPLRNESVQLTNESKYQNITRIGMLAEAKILNVNSRVICNPSEHKKPGTILCYEYKNQQEIFSNGLESISQRTILEKNICVFKLFSYEMLSLCGVSVPKTIWIGYKGRISPDCDRIQTNGPLVGYFIGEDITDATSNEKNYYINSRKIKSS